MRVAFLGPAGTFTEEALRASAPGEVEEVPYPTVYEAVMAVQDGDADRAVVPIENSLEGGVAATLDALAGEADRVRIAAELVHPIHHCWWRRRELDLGEVTRVVSHPQATAQCARFLRDALGRRRARLGHLDLGGGPPGPRRRTSPGSRSARDWPPSSTAAACSPPTSRTTPTTRPASSGSRPPGDEVDAGPARQDLDRLLGLQRRVAGRAGRRCCASSPTAGST